MQSIGFFVQNYVYMKSEDDVYDMGNILYNAS